MKVFVSSTVYDLLDIRAEIAELLRSLDISPVLSDDPISDSIESSAVVGATPKLSHGSRLPGPHVTRPQLTLRMPHLPAPGRFVV